MSWIGNQIDCESAIESGDENNKWYYTTAAEDILYPDVESKLETQHDAGNERQMNAKKGLTDVSE